MDLEERLRLLEDRLETVEAELDRVNNAVREDHPRIRMNTRHLVATLLLLGTLAVTVLPEQFQKHIRSGGFKADLETIVQLLGVVGTAGVLLTRRDDNDRRGQV